MARVLYSRRLLTSKNVGIMPPEKYMMNMKKAMKTPRPGSVFLESA